VHPSLALQRRNQPDEGQPHHDHHDAAGALQRSLVAYQRVRQPHDAHQDRAEHEREPGDEQRRRPGHPPAARPRSAGLLDGGRRGLGADEAGEVGEVAGDQRDDARRREADRAGQHRNGDRREQRAADREAGRGVHQVRE
jgi:hypothetical protein